ncbi:hypothetical protein HPP92_009970 [Vanilla planifolia]|uniref:Uncharacterized protein n=1 Tax=Vanilla planifolia TaxID=51239 RepID=A0A835V3L9_VANPL|nr:hypothetical protein HPP92_009970 [Vanilla planifolia]
MALKGSYNEPMSVRWSIDKALNGLIKIAERTSKLMEQKVERTSKVDDCARIQARFRSYNGLSEDKQMKVRLSELDDLNEKS